MTQWRKLLLDLNVSVFYKECCVLLQFKHLFSNNEICWYFALFAWCLLINFVFHFYNFFWPTRFGFFCSGFSKFLSWIINLSICTFISFLPLFWQIIFGSQNIIISQAPFPFIIPNLNYKSIVVYNVTCMCGFMVGYLVTNW